MVFIGIITWTPDKNTPDTVYYQCFTHRYLGWKINVLDACDTEAHASDRQEVIVDFEAEPSIRHESKLAPSENFLKQHEKDLIKHHNMNGSPPLKHLDEIQNNSEFNMLITEGIKTAEALEAALIQEQRNNGTKHILPNNRTNHNEKNNKNGDNGELINEKFPSLSEVKQAPRRPPLTPQQLMSRPHFSSSQIPIYLRSPQSQSQQILPLYRPHKGQYPIPMGPIIQRRPIERRPLPPPPPFQGIPSGSIDRRPPQQQQNHHHQQQNHQQQHHQQSRPYLLPQSSMQINHYRKPIHSQPPPQLSSSSSIRNSFIKNKVPFNALPQKPVLMLGEPTEINAPYRKSSDVVIGKPSQHQIDLTTAFKTKKINENQLRVYSTKGNNNIEKNPVKSPFKEPFNIKNLTSSDDLVENTGFKAESIIVESGFRPIFNHEDVFSPDNTNEGSDEQVNTSKISRRSDNDFYEDDEEEEYDDDDEHENQFHQSDLPQSFEPVFVPSPADSVPVNKDSDLMAEASERQSVFYLPPNEVKRSAVLDPLDQINLKDPLPSENYQKISQKTKKFIQDNPQFRPFKGELPFILGNHEGPSYSTVIKEKSSSPISTRLSAVKTNNDS